MAIGDVKTRLKEAFARLNEHIDTAEDAVFAGTKSGPAVLGAELAQARSMLDVIATRLSAIPAADRSGLEQKLAQLRRRWSDAQQSFDAGKASGGEVRAEDERKSRKALDEVQDGLLQLVSEMNTRFAGHPPAPGPT
jgi:hypothetical protein